MTVLYGSNVADITLSSACQMATTTGGTETSSTTTIASTSNPYAEVRSKGGASTAVAALPAPTGNGWIFWPGQAGTFAAGNWSASITKSYATRGVSTTVRFYKYSAGTYTAIGTITANNTTTAKTTYSFAATAMPSVSLTATEGIYVDLWHFDNNANAGGDNPTVYISNSATAGVANDMQITTSTFTPSSTQTSKDVAMRGYVSQQIAKDLAMRGYVSELAPGKDVAMRGNVGVPPVKKDVTMRGNVSQQTAKDVVMRGYVSQLATGKDIAMRGKTADTSDRDVTMRGKVSQQSRKDIAMRGNVGGIGLKLVAMRGNVSQQAGKNLAMRGNISGPRLATGGFSLYGNGASGSIKFNTVRYTQYPDPALSLSPVLPRLGTSSVSWNENTPDNTSLTVKTSLDGVNWTTATSGDEIAGLTGQPAPTIDVFTSDTSANYTSTNKSGGATATVTFDPANSRLTLSGGSGALFLNSSLSDDDVEIIVDMDRSDAGGIVWRYQDASNYYELGCYDDSSSAGFTNQLRLYKVASGTRSLLGTASVITWARATAGQSPYKTVKITMLGAIISVYLDGMLYQTYTDATPLSAGKMGLRNDGGTSRYYQLRIQPYGDLVSGTPDGDVVTGKFVYTQVSMNSTDPATTPQLYDLTTSARSPQIETGALITQLHDPSLAFSTPLNDEMDSLVQSSGDFWWQIANDGSTTFASRHATKAPWCLYSTDLQYRPDVSPTFGSDLYRNRQTITNCINTIQVDKEQKITDGTTTTWNMAYQLYSAPTITVGGVAKTVGVAGVDTGKDFYWSAGSSTITADSNKKLPTGYLIEVTYVGQYKDKVTRDNLAEQAAQQAREGNTTTGIVEATEDGKGMLVSNAIVYADGLLARYGNPNPINLRATTLRSGLKAGMILSVFIPEFNLNNRQLLIVKVTTTAQQVHDGVLYSHEIEATDGANLNNWAKALAGK